MSEYGSDGQLVERVTAGLNHAADAAFPEERLARQRARILQRLAQDDRPGRIISFPGVISRTPAAALLHTSSRNRWVAAAAAVAFIAGLLAGQRLPHEVRFAPAGQSARQVPQTAGTTLRGAAPFASSDDEFLSQIEVAAESRPAVLRHIDAITPRAWDVEVAR